MRAAGDPAFPPDWRTADIPNFATAHAEPALLVGYRDPLGALVAIQYRFIDIIDRRPLPAWRTLGAMIGTGCAWRNGQTPDAILGLTTEPSSAIALAKRYAIPVWAAGYETWPRHDRDLTVAHFFRLKDVDFPATVRRLVIFATEAAEQSAVAAAREFRSRGGDAEIIQYKTTDLNRGIHGQGCAAEVDLL